MTPDLLRAATSSSRTHANMYAPHLTHACEFFGIAGADILAAFLAQLAHESGSLQYVRELADGSAYEGRVDLGNTQPGDGRRFRGRGLSQLTGRANAAAFRDAMRAIHGASVPDFEADPDALELPEWAAWSAAWFWHEHGLSDLADGSTEGFVRIGRAINRGNADSPKPANHEPERLARWATAKAAIAADAATINAPAPLEGPATGWAGGEAAAAREAAGSPSMPAGEAPDWTPPPAPEPPAMVAPILAGIGKSIVVNALPSIVQAIPRLGALFATSEQAQKNVKALEVVTQVAADAIGATNAQELVEGLQDRDKAAAARNVVDNNWASILDLVEAGGGGIDGARKADRAVMGERTFLWSPSFWMGVLLLPIVYLIVLNVIGVLGTAQWSPEARAGLAGMLSGTIVGGLVGYYYGQTTSRNRAQSAQ